MSFLLLLLLAACGSPVVPPPTTSPAPTSAAPTCPEPGVAITTGVVSAAMGLRAMTVELRNCGTADFPLDGYPEVRVLDEDKDQLPITIGHGDQGVPTGTEWDDPPQPLVLHPGERARAGLVWRNTLTDGPPAVGRYLVIAPLAGQPGQTVEDGPDQPPVNIDLGSTGKLGVQAWRR